MNRRRDPVTLLEAAEGAPTMARLLELARESSRRLHLVHTLIPPALRPAVLAGPIEGDAWCLLVEGNAAAAKLRQLVPALQAHLRGRGCEVNSIRVKVQITRK